MIVKVVYFLTKKVPLQFNGTLTKNITLLGFDIYIQTLLRHSVGIQFHFWEKSASCRIPDQADKLGIEFENVQLTLLFQEKNVDFFICSRFSLVFSTFSFSKHDANFKMRLLTVVIPIFSVFAYRAATKARGKFKIKR